MRRAVLDAAGAKEATERVLQRYGIQQAHVLGGPAAGN
jgi:hypothetical protein